jgi:hypothetical protein
MYVSMPPRLTSVAEVMHLKFGGENLSHGEGHRMLRMLERSKSPIYCRADGQAG